MDDNYKPAEGGFIELLQLQRGGLLEEELDKAISRIVALAGDESHDNKGKVSISFEIEKVGEHDGVFKVTEKVAVAEPKLKRTAEIRFRTAGLGLIEDHQEQIRLFGDPEGGEIEKADQGEQGEAA